MDARFLFLSKTHPFHGGGAELRTWELAKRFVEFGSQVTILTSEVGAPSDKPDSIAGVRFEYLPATPFAWSGIAQVAFLAPRVQFFLTRSPLLTELIVEDRPDLVHDDITPFPIIKANRLCLESEIPEVATVHILRGRMLDWARIYGPVGVGGAVGEAMLRGGFLRYSHIITDSQWLRTDLLRDIAPGQVTWIPNGVNIDEFHPHGSHFTSTDVDLVRFLYVGRFIGWKGHRVLLEAFAGLLKEGVPAKLLLVGTGPDLENIHRLCRDFQIEDHVSFLGWIPHSEMPTVYSRADVFVLPSAPEGLSVALIEAMSSGLAVVASDFPGNRDVTGTSSALLTRHGDSEGLRAAMKKLAQNPDLRSRLGTAGRQTVVENFSWDRVAQAQFELFRKCVEA